MRHALVPFLTLLLVSTSAPAEDPSSDDWFESHNGSVFDLAFTPDGKTLISAGADHRLRFSRADSVQVDQKEQRRRRQLFAKLDSKSFEVRQRAFGQLADLGESITGDLQKRLAASTSNESDLRARWLLTLAATPRGVGHHEEVRGVAIAADGETVASASRDNVIGLWSVTSGRAISIIQGHTDGVWCVDFSREGMQLASGGGDHVVRIWDTKTLAATREFNGHNSTIHDVQFSSDGAFLASAGGFDHSVRVWSLETNGCEHIFDTHADAVVCLDISPDGKTIISGDYDGSVYLWDLESGELTKSFPAHRGVVRDVKFIPGHQNRMISIGDDGVVKGWNFDEPDQPGVLLRAHVGLCRMAFSPDAKSLAIGGRDGHVRRIQLVVDRQ